MHVRSLTFTDFRAFRGDRHFTFVDPLTDRGILLAAVTGTNGAGKTTILETIDALLSCAADPETPLELIREAWETGFAALEVDVTAEDLRSPDGDEAPATWSRASPRMVTWRGLQMSWAASSGPNEPSGSPRAGPSSLAAG